MQTDDYCFLRVGVFIANLQLMVINHLFWGDIPFNAAPIRDPAVKGYVSKEEWMPDLYPPWAPGLGYVISLDLVVEIAACGQS